MKLTSKPKTPEKITTEQELLDFLTLKLNGPNNPLIIFLENKIQDSRIDFDGLYAALLYELGNYSIESDEYKFGTEAIELIKVREGDFNSWTDSERGPDLNFQG